MGKSPKPITILVSDDLFDKAEIRALADKGHRVQRLSETGHYASDADPETADLILSPRAWRMDASLLKYLDLAIRGAWTVKYPKKSAASGVNEVQPTSVGE